MKKKTNQIKESIRDTLEKNEKINEELRKLKDKKATQNKSEELRDFLLLKVDNVVKLIDENSKDQIKALNEEAKMKESEIDAEIEKLNKLIKNTQLNVDVLLKTVIKKNEGYTIVEEKALKDKSEFKLIKYKEKSNSKTMLQNDNDNEEEESKIAVNDDNMNMLDDKIKAETKKEEIKKSSEKDFTEERNTSFWDDKIEEESINLEKKENITSETEVIMTKKAQIPIKSEAVLNSIDNMRNRYIVGKLAGEDLFSKNGELIISKNSVITEDIIQKSESAGKLAELIINMTIPDTLQ